MSTCWYHWWLLGSCRLQWWCAQMHFRLPGCLHVVCLRPSLIKWWGYHWCRPGTVWGTEHRPVVLLHKDRLFCWECHQVLLGQSLQIGSAGSTFTSWFAHRSSVVSQEVPLSRPCQMHLRDRRRLPEPSFSPGMHLWCSAQGRQVGPLC